MTTVPFVLHAGFVLVLLLESVHPKRHDSPPAERALLKNGQAAVGHLLITSTGALVFQQPNTAEVIQAEQLAHVEFSRLPRPTQEPSFPLHVQLWSGESFPALDLSLDRETAKFSLLAEDARLVPRDILASVTAAGRPEIGPPSLPEVPRLRVDRDRLTLRQGEQIFGSLHRFDAQSVVFDAAFGRLTIPTSEVRQLLLARKELTTRLVSGWLVELRLQGDAPEAATCVLRGALHAIHDDAILLEHPLLGRVQIPRRVLKQLQIFARGRRLEIDPTEHHLGDEPRPDFSLPIPEGHELQRRVSFTELPAETPHLVCEVRHLEGVGEKEPFARQLADGHLRTQVWINGQLIDYLNRYVDKRSLDLQRIVVRLPPALLHTGENTVRVEQTSEKNDSGDFDDFLISGLALEFHENAAADEQGKFFRGNP